MSAFTIPLPRYQCHKQVSALKISAIVDNPRGVELHFENKSFVPIQVDANWAVRHNPAPGGYIVWYDGDGYVSYSPAAAFEAGYRPINPDVVVDDETAKARMDASLWDFIDTAAANPSAKPDPRVWDHVMVYSPVGPATQAAVRVHKCQICSDTGVLRQPPFLNKPDIECPKCSGEKQAAREVGK